MVNNDGAGPGKQDRPLLEAIAIRKGFAYDGTRIEVLRNVNLAINRGETLAIVGASGIGKSTLLHILGTLERADQGKLIFEGQDLSNYDEKQLARFRNLKMGFVFQFHHLLSEFTALENTMLPALIGGVEKKHARKAALEMLERVGMADKQERRINRLSGGEQQRVALARALIQRPDLLLADEPTGNLDLKNSQRIHQLLLDLNQDFGMSLVVVTHNLELAAMMDQRVTIVEGELVTAELT